MAKNHQLASRLESAKTMQVATVSDGQPWICTVYFVVDGDLNIYWLSWPTRRHSKEIAKNPRVAVALQCKVVQPVVGIQAEGRVEIVSEAKTVEVIMQKYVKKYSKGKAFYSNFVAGKNQHKMYKFLPEKFVLFDESNNPVNPRQEISLK